MAAHTLQLCLIAPPSLRIPPSSYGGTQRGIRDLIVGLRRRGHHVTLLGPGDSTVEVDALLPTVPAALWESDSQVPEQARGALTAAHVERAVELCARNRFDLINVRHDHAGLLEQLVAQPGPPLLYSLHNSRDAFFDGFFARLVGAERRLAISAHGPAHAAQFAELEGVHVIPYGMDVAATPWSDRALPQADWEPTLALLRELRADGRGYVVTIGRISPEKGQVEAVAIARAAGERLVIGGAAEARDPAGAAYHRDRLLPLVDGEQVLWAGRIDEAAKRELIRGARALLFLSGMATGGTVESFGRPIMEALSAGTPVVAFPAGDGTDQLTPEVGAIGRTHDELVAGLLRAPSLDRRRCRAHALERFGLDRFAGDAERLFRRLIDAHARGEPLGR